MAVGVRRFFCLLNVAVAFVTLASALAVLYSDLAVPGYREHHRDALWFVSAYAAVQVVMLVEFARDGRLVPWLALAKAVAAWFLITFLDSLWPRWSVWTPARYVYLLFDWGESTGFGMYALIYLGRGLWNTLNTAYFTKSWWMRLRVTAPFLGRVVTGVPLAGMIFCAWKFINEVRLEAQLSPEAQAVAQLVYEGLECDAIRANDGRVTYDVRQRGERRYDVRIAWGCAQTRVVVRSQDGRMGGISGPRQACCSPPKSSSRDADG
jgi:hypothetical protein